jgi:hypothetical protein
MSQFRPGFQPKFSSKGAFDALPVEDVPTDDEEEEPVIVEPVVPYVVLGSRGCIR